MGVRVLKKKKKTQERSKHLHMLVTVVFQFITNTSHKPVLDILL